MNEKDCSEMTERSSHKEGEVDVFYNEEEKCNHGRGEDGNAATGTSSQVSVCIWEDCYLGIFSHDIISTK